MSRPDAGRRSNAGSSASALAIITIPDDPPPAKRRQAPKIVPKYPVIRSMDDSRMSSIRSILNRRASALIDETPCLLALLTADLPRIRIGTRGQPDGIPTEQVEYSIRIFEIVIDIEDIKGLFGWITSPVANSLFFYYSNKRMGGDVLLQPKLFGTSKIYKWADRVFICSADVLSFANDQTSTPRALSEKVDAFVNSVFGEILSLGHSVFPTRECAAGGPIILLIPYTKFNTHWYLFCIYITRDMTRLIVFNSIRGTDHISLSDALHTGITKHSRMLTGPESVDHGTVIRYEKYGQNNGRDCGVYMVFYAAKIQNDPGWVRVIIDANPCDLAFSPKNKTPFNVDAARSNMCLGIFHLFSIRRVVEETAALLHTVDGREYDADLVHVQRVNAVKDFMRTKNVNLLLDNLNEFNFSPQDINEAPQAPKTSTANPLTCTVHQYYESAPHVTRWYAGINRTVSSGSSQGHVYFNLDDFVNSLDRDPSLHDTHHGWIQTAFATDEKSRHNPMSPLLTREDCAFLKHSPVLAQRLLFVVVRYGLNGIGVGQNTGLLRAPLNVIENGLFQQRVLNDTHYRARISRLLYFLRLTGFEHLAHELYALLMTYQNQGRIINYDKSHVEWRKAITRELWSGRRD